MSSSIGSRALAAAAALATSRRPPRRAARAPRRPPLRVVLPAAREARDSALLHDRRFVIITPRRSRSASASSSSSSEALRIRPGDRGLPIVYHPRTLKPRSPRGTVPHARVPRDLPPPPPRRRRRPGANIFRPAASRREELEAAHDPAYVDAFCSGALDERAMRGIGFPWSEALVEHVGGGCGDDAGRRISRCSAASPRTSPGGTHHARRARGSGFCILNDLAVTAKRVLDQGRVDRVLIVDLDVHQGDGTASILADDPRAFTLSVHCAENFPRVKETGGDRDVALPAGTGDDAYVAAVTAALRESLEAHDPCGALRRGGGRSRADALGGLRVTDEGLIGRETTVGGHVRGAGRPDRRRRRGGGATRTSTRSRGDCHLAPRREGRIRRETTGSREGAGVPIPPPSSRGGTTRTSTRSRGDNASPRREGNLREQRGRVRGAGGGGGKRRRRGRVSS